MKKTITILFSLLIALAGKAQAQMLDVHNPMGLWRGIPYLSNWSQRWLTNQNGAGAAAFWLSDTNAALSFWTFMQPFAYAQNTNALTAQQQSAINSLLGGYLLENYDCGQYSLSDLKSVASSSFNVAVPATITVTNCGSGRDFITLRYASLDGVYDYIAVINSSQANLPMFTQHSAFGNLGNLIYQALPQTLPLIPGLPNSTSAYIYSATFPFVSGNEFPGPYEYFVAYDPSRVKYSLYGAGIINNQIAIVLCFTTDTLPANYVYSPTGATNLLNLFSGSVLNTPGFTTGGGTPLYGVGYNANNDLAILPAASSSSNLNLSTMSLQAASITAQSIVANGSALTGITVSQVSGAVPNTDASYQSIPTVTTTANNALSTANTANSTATANSAAITTLTARLNYGTNTVAAANTAPYTWVQPAFAFNTPYVNPSDRRATLFVDIQYTNTTGFQLQNSTAGWTWPFTNMFSGQRSDLFILPMSPGDTVQITTNSYSAMIRSSWLRED